MTIRQTLSDLQQRLNVLLGIPENERNEYVRGSVEQLAWCRDRLTQSIAEILPTGDNDTDDEDDLEEDERLIVQPLTLSPIRPPQYATTPCVPHRTHAYIPRQPHEDYKQCRYCGDIRLISHGDKIAAGRNK